MALNAITQALDTTDMPTQRPVLEEIQDGLIQAVAAVQELQRLKVAVVAGAAANTNIAVAGITTQDTLVVVVELSAPEESIGTAAATDRTAQSSITSAGNIQVTVATNTNANRRLLVLWYDKT